MFTTLETGKIETHEEHEMYDVLYEALSPAYELDEAGYSAAVKALMATGYVKA